MFVFLSFVSVFLFSTAGGSALANEHDSINFSTIKDQAIFARAAYLSENKARELIDSKDFSLTVYRTIPDSQISYFIATDEQTKSQIIAIRGTSNIVNALIDIELKLVTDEYSGLRLHQGFSEAAREIHKQIKPQLKAEYKIDITGHSLGGAIAQILAIYLDIDQFKIGRITTFGQPKVTNFAGASRFDHLNIIRVVTATDIVPLAPLIDPLDINDLDIYWHAGKEVILLDDNQYAVLQGINSMLRVTRFTQKAPNEKNLTQHLMSYYLEKLEAITHSAKRVPYENSFNLFNLFGSD